MEQEPLVQIPSPYTTESNQPEQVADVSEARSSKKPLVIIGMVLGCFLFGVGGFVLGTLWSSQQQRIFTSLPITSSTPSPTSSPSTASEPSPTSASASEEIGNSLPSGWSYKSNGRCDVQFAIPPKSEPYYQPHDPSRPPSVTVDAASGRFWDFPRGGVMPSLLSKLPNWDDTNFDIQASAMFASQGEASGYVSSAVSVSCIDNSNNLTNQTLMSLLNSGFEKHNLETRDKGMQPDTYTIASSKQANRWGHAVIDLTVSELFQNPGGQPFTKTVQYTTFATPKYLYEIKVFGDSEDAFVKQTAQEIFENLKFN